MAAHQSSQAAIIEDDEVDYESLSPNSSMTANMLAGAFAGIMEHTVMYPIDAIKTRMQVVNPSPAAVYTGVTNAVARISSVEGVRALWRGMTSVVMGAGPAHAVHFATYEFVKESVGGNESGHRIFETAVAGGCATIANDALMNPFDVIKQRMQMHGSTYKSVPEAARAIHKAEGFRAFYISYPTTLTMNIPFTAIQFSAYESFSQMLNPTKKYDPLSHVIAGGLAGATAAALTTPLDVIKTLLQTRGSSQDERIRKCSSMKEAAKIIYETQGSWGFLRGLRPRIISSVPATAICWGSYEAGKEIYKRTTGEA
ncbi:mitochondrial carrier [Saitoella complicata NRRL Y-17804]|uniref:mitochondrial carrier n=1 Tax=Saitoella complicata (strain BCRC 22490 / CBS 7301 / JCM 7358 / NBRC 10748 / NRRL Y-17804) TaxID=698492 RepID=UPI0008682C2B|nr:mitochondrial carrier [Saitoella complicata NRRL Y-17804]ODQ51437.1 mitochondrial carrier [Saitoella complicata NRRL Y-17804]